MKRILTPFLIVVLLIGLAFPAWGSVGLGTRAMGMGGAFTAVADDESAFYWNPAGITQVKYVFIMFGAGAQGEDYDFIIDTVDIISDTEQLNPQDFESGFGHLNLGLIGGVTTRFVGTNFYSETSGSVKAEKSSEYDYDIEVDLNNFSYAVLTLAGNFGEKFSAGLNLKKVVAGIGYGVVNLGESYTGYADGDGFACDVGFLYRLSDQVKFGFTVRNLGKKIDLDGEEIEYPGSGQVEYPIFGTIELPRDIAVGISYRPFKNTLLAFDVQKCDARPFTPGQTRFRFGFEQTTFWNIIAIRLGAYTNKDESMALTAGVGFDLGPLEVGVAGIREEINGEKADEAIVTVGLRF